MGRKIGIMGGTFNPIHIGHLMLAEHAYEEFSLDEVIFLPSARPPHKSQHILSNIDRREMILLAIEDNPHFSFSSLEFERKGTTYTIDTMSELNKRYPMDTFYFIIGADSFFALESWHNPKILFGQTSFLVATRDGHQEEELKKHKDKLEKQYQAKIEFLNFPNIEISSSNIRKRVMEGKFINYYVPKMVEEYIYSHNLYR
ncbi:MAG: nicotinate-nucleotide adenylyltransferase [Lachnospiraceae bacterium]|nr:nicotinate-nucleotide adenylyltransferase [Lachnospiraceae bacterium]